MPQFTTFSPEHTCSHISCDQIWRNFATLAKNSKFLAIHFRVYLVVGQIKSLLWQKFNAVRHILVVLNGLIWNKYCSHLFTLGTPHTLSLSFSLSLAHTLITSLFVPSASQVGVLVHRWLAFSFQNILWQPVWSDLLKFCHFGEILQVFGNFGGFAKTFAIFLTYSAIFLQQVQFSLLLMAKYWAYDLFI